MSNYLTIGARYPRLTLLLLALVTVWCIPQLAGLTFRISAEEIMLQGDQGRAAYDLCRDLFGEGDGVTLYLHDSHLLDAGALEAVRGAVKAIESLPCVDSTFSLFSLRHVWVDDHEVVHSEPYLDRVPQEQEGRRDWLEEVRRNPLAADNLISDDGNTMAVWIQLRGRHSQRAADATVTREINAIIRPLQNRLEKVFIVGSPVTRHAITDKIIADQKIILPAAVAFLLLILGLVMRRLSGALIPLATAALSVIWTLAFMATLGIPVNVMTSIVPALLIVVGSTEDIHLLAEYYDGIDKGMDGQAALDRMARNMGMAVFLTFLTTSLGFLAIAANPIPLLRSFGVVAAVGLSLNFAITCLLTPAWLKLHRDKAAAALAAEGLNPFQRLALLLLKIAQRGKYPLLFVLLALLVGAVTEATRIRVNNDPLNYFKPDEPVLQQFNELQAGLTGGHTFSIVLDGRIDGTFAKVRYLQTIRELQRYLDATGLFRKSLSFADIVALVNTSIGDDATAAPYLPERDEEVQDCLLFLDRAEMASFVSPDFSRARIVVRHGIRSSAELDRAVAKVRSYLDQQLPRGIHADITGAEILTNRAAEYMTMGQAVSLGLILACVWILVGLVFVNVRAGLVALLPNLLPIALLFGSMGYFGIDLDTSTALVAAVALGICVDNSMHFMVRFHRNCRSGGICRSTAEGLHHTVRSEATPIFSTSLALAAGFSLLLLSDFPPIGMFGLLSALVILTALLATFLVTPLLLSSMRLVTLWDMLDLKLRRKVREDCPLFRDMSVWQIKKLILVSDVRSLQAGEVLFRSGDWGSEMYVVLEGGVEVLGTDQAGAEVRSRCGHGELVGETALLHRASRSVTATAVEPTTLLVLHWDGIRRIARLFPHTATRLFFNLSGILERRLGKGVTG